MNVHGELLHCDYCLESNAAVAADTRRRTCLAEAHTLYDEWLSLPAGTVCTGEAGRRIYGSHHTSRLDAPTCECGF